MSVSSYATTSAADSDSSVASTTSNIAKGRKKKKTKKALKPGLTVDQRPMPGGKQTTKVGIRSVGAQTSSLRLSFLF